MILDLVYQYMYIVNNTATHIYSVVIHILMIYMQTFST